MEAQGLLDTLFENEGVTVYGVKDGLLQRPDGAFVPAMRNDGSKG